jgi:hypothetical protein
MVISKTGETSVEFELRVYQQEIDTGLGSTIPGLKSCKGWVRPFCGTFGEMMTLKMRDRRTAAFFFTDGSGTVQVTGPINDPV